MKNHRMHYSREACPAILERNARTASRAEAACGVLLAVALGVLGAVLLVHYLTPCEAGQLCLLTGATLDRRQSERELSRLSLPDLLLRQGSMHGPYRRTRPATLTLWMRIRRALRIFIFRHTGKVI